MRRHGILVLGMHRSGTSALTGILNILGADAPAKLVAGNEHNPRGYWESPEIMAIHDELLASLSASWDDVGPLRVRCDELQPFRARILHLIERDFAGKPVFVIKDPRMARLAPLWLSVFEELDVAPRAVLIVRNPLEVARSLAKRDKLSLSHGQLLWLRHVLEAERATRSVPRSFVMFDDLLADWRPVVEKLVNDLDLACLQPATEQAAAIDRFLSCDLRHHSARAEPLRHDPSWYRRALNGLERMARSPEAAGPQSELDAVHGMLEQADQVFAPLLADKSAMLRRLSEELEQNRSDLAELAEQLADSREQAPQLRTVPEFATPKLPRMVPIRAPAIGAAHLNGGHAPSPSGPTVFVCHADHDNDRVFTENVVEHLQSRGVACKTLQLADTGQRPELQLCLDQKPTAVLGFNSQLDHSWISSDNFVEAAADQGIAVLQWIVDHPSARWHEFNVSNASNSRYLLNSKFAEDYFKNYCLPDAVTATMGGVGPNRRSRIAKLSLEEFAKRPIGCLVAMSLRRLAGTPNEVEARICGLEKYLADAVRSAAETARFDLCKPTEAHLVAALNRSSADVLSCAQRLSLTIPDQVFGQCCHLLEESVQIFRRTKILEVARRYPVLVQSDETASPILRAGKAEYSASTDAPSTLSRMQACRAVLSVSPVNDMIHDRTMNGLNAGCVAIVEDSAAHRRIFEHGKNALLFRYDDDSLEECLDIACNNPTRAFAIAEAGFKLRDHKAIRFGEFDNILRLAGRQTGS
jgi:hypothetical protein